MSGRTAGGSRSVSRHCPGGHVNDWPTRDAVAFQRLVEAAEARMAEFDEDDIHAVQAAAAEMGLKRRHWMVREVLAGVYGRFDIWRGFFYAQTAEVFLRLAGAEAMEHHGPEGVAWARRLAGVEADRGPRFHLNGNTVRYRSSDLDAFATGEASDG